jgi:hypothetical protein
MRRVVRDVAEERLGAMFVDEVDCLVGEIVRDVSLAADRFAVVFQRRIVILAPVTGGEAIIVLEAARVGMVWPLAAVVPIMPVR